MEGRSLTEYVVLGSLIAAPRHGYEIKQFLGSTLESTWRVSTSQLYALLKRLEQERLIQGNLEAQETRPSKRVLTLTDEGKAIFMDWLQRPTKHVRDFRMEFMTKLFFFFHYSIPGADELVVSQIGIIKARIKEIQNQSEKNRDPFKTLVFEYKIQMMEGVHLWLSTKAVSFAGRLKTD
ncbi:PadR family transcriptional regulator [Thermodesulfobacteriota bacterium]